MRVVHGRDERRPRGRGLRGRERRPDWNQRPRDLANLAQFSGEGIERELHWQVLAPERSVEEWLDAPILYISGSTALNFSDELKTKLKRYAGLGGLIAAGTATPRRRKPRSTTS